jgi:hypothetical protein
LVAHHRIQDREKLSHASGERYLLQFASFQQLLVLGLDHRLAASGDEVDM